MMYYKSDIIWDRLHKKYSLYSLLKSTQQHIIYTQLLKYKSDINTF